MGQYFLVALNGSLFLLYLEETSTFSPVPQKFAHKYVPTSPPRVKPVSLLNSGHKQRSEGLDPQLRPQLAARDPGRVHEVFEVGLQSSYQPHLRITSTQRSAYEKLLSPKSQDTQRTSFQFELPSARGKITSSKIEVL